MLSPWRFAFAFRAYVARTLAEIRADTIRSVIGRDEDEPDGLTLLENGPDRFASRLHIGEMAQLRVVEWSEPQTAHGSVEHAIDGRPRLAARYELNVTPVNGRLRLDVTYVLDTPSLGLALSFRFSRRRSLARRLAASWLRVDDPGTWAAIELRPVPRGPATAHEQALPG